MSKMAHKRIASTELLSPPQARRPRLVLTPRRVKSCGDIKMASPPSIEPTVELDRRLSYRLGTPILPTLPLNTNYGPSPEGYRQIRGAIQKVLHEERVVLQTRVPNWDCVKRYRSDQVPKDVGYTLLIMADSLVDGQMECWGNAIRRLRKLLDDASLAPAIPIIEFIDFGAVDGLITNVLSASNMDLADSWPVWALDVVELVRTQEWSAINLVERGFNREEHRWQPTVVITASDAYKDIWWTSVLPKIRSKIPARVHVELTFGNTIFSVEEEPPEDVPTVVVHSNYNSTFYPGSSIGLEGIKQTSTLGFALELEKDGEKFWCGLSNHHVVDDDLEESEMKKLDPEELKSYIKAKTEQEDKYGKWPKDQALTPSHRLVSEGALRVSSPSDGDHRLQLARLEYDSKEADISIAHQELKESWELDKGRVLVTKTTKALCEARKLVVQGDRFLGTVYATSGRRQISNPLFDHKTIKSWTTVKAVSPVGKLLKPEIERQGTVGWYIDWSLIKVDAPRKVHNYLESEVSKIPQVAKITRYQDIDLQSNWKVAKVGRTTWTTSGRINSAAAVLNIRDDTSPIAPVDSVHRPNKVGLACGIVACGDDHKAFLAPGDSGSAVMLDRADKDATVVGLAFGVTVAQGVSYMMPFRMVLDDIEKITGAKVVNLS